MTWQLCDETTKGVNQLKANLTGIENTKSILLIGFTKNFLDAIEHIFDTKPHITLIADLLKHPEETTVLAREQCDVVIDCSFDTNDARDMLREKFDVGEFDLIYIEGDMTKKLGPMLFRVSSDLQPENVLWDKTHIDIVNLRIGICIQEVKQSVLNMYCHIRYKDTSNNNCMLSVLRRFDL